MLDYFHINTSALMIMPLYNSIVPSIIIKDDEELPILFNILCWDNGLINTYLNGSLYFVFEKDKYTKQMKHCNFSLKDHISKSIELETVYEDATLIVERTTLLAKWKQWIDHIKNNEFDKLDAKYILSTCINAPEVLTPDNNIAKYVVNYNLPWGILNNYPDYVNKIKQDLNTKFSGKWSINIYDPEREVYSIEKLMYI